MPWPGGPIGLRKAIEIIDLATSTDPAIKRLQEALGKDPDDIALNHYLIHILESGSDYEQGGTAANSLAKVGGNSGHLTHMPDHIFYLAGEYQKTGEAFLKCQRVEISHLEKEKIPASDHLNYLHNLQDLTQAAADHGNDRLAHETAKTMASIKVPPGWEKSFARDFVHLLKYNCLLKSLLLQGGPLTSKQLTKALEISGKQSESINALKAATPKFSAEGQPLAFAQKTAEIFEVESKTLIKNAQASGGSAPRLASFYIAIRKDDIYTEPLIIITPVAETLAWFALAPRGPPSVLRRSFETEEKSGHCYRGMSLAHQKVGNSKKS